VSSTGTEERSITIERAEASDRDELATMYSADMQDLGIDLKSDDLLPLVNATLEGQEENNHSWIAKAEEGVIAGVILASTFWSLKVAGRALWIEELYVKPDFRRRGIAGALVEHVLDWAEENELKGVELEAYRLNTGASILYREFGFRRLARERYCYHFGVDDQ
jgi:ribosomal protein S18 acetylase RimI-like enzyme